MSLNLLPAARISSTALSAEKARMQIAANNMANAHSTKGPDGKVYERKVAVFNAIYNDKLGQRSEVDALGGVDMVEVATGRNKLVKRFMPYHPDADENGMVEMPDISPIEEMLDMITATRSYEANLSVMKQSKDMAEKTIMMTK